MGFWYYGRRGRRGAKQREKGRARALVHQEGFKTDDSMVCHLLRNLYGMKQASRCWHKDINDFLITTMRMKSLSSTHCIYLKRLSESDWLVIILYVDDLLICLNIDEAIKEAFRQLGKWKIR